jgi:L-ascorbate metabolism protein UlaG (beta-lactamase superfamily)
MLAVTWVGHATVLLELDGARVLTDPVLRDRLGALVRIAPPVGSGAAERIDAALLSHLHADHADIPSLRRLGRSARVIVPRGAGRWLARRGVGNVVEARVGEEHAVGPVLVRATPAAHDARRWPIGVRADPVGYVVRGSRSVYFAGDTDLFTGMRDLAGSIDVALLPVAGWGRSLGPGHLDPARAAEAVALIRPRVAVPIHWGTLAPVWPLQRPDDQHAAPREFAALTARLSPEVEVRVLAPGERIEVA